MCDCVGSLLKFAGQSALPVLTPDLPVATDCFIVTNRLRARALESRWLARCHSGSCIFLSIAPKRSSPRSEVSSTSSLMSHRPPIALLESPL
jgi:hypothetical protein